MAIWLGNHCYMVWEKGTASLHIISGLYLVQGCYFGLGVYGQNPKP